MIIHVPNDEYTSEMGPWLGGKPLPQKTIPCSLYLPSIHNSSGHMVQCGCIIPRIKVVIMRQRVAVRFELAVLVLNLVGVYSRLLSKSSFGFCYPKTHEHNRIVQLH